MTTLYVAGSGGHLAELLALRPAVALGDDEIWVTHQTIQTESALKGHEAMFVPYVRVRSISDVARCLPHARRVHRSRRITRAVSTGSSIALGFLPYLAARGVECHYIESAARVTGPSLTGRLLQRLPGVRTYTQHASWAGEQWEHMGSVFDGYVPQPERTNLDTPLRAVVMVGSAPEFPFRRMIESLVPLLAPNGPLARATGAPPMVLWQTGATPVDDLPIETVAFLAAHELEAALRRADIVISHAGVGSAIAAFDQGRQPILVPRDPTEGESGDVHQHQLASALARRGLALRREPSAITVDDLLEVAGRSVARVEAPAATGALRPRPRTTLYLATTGGHLAQLSQIADRLTPATPTTPSPTADRSFWVTHENEQSRSILHGRTAEFVRYVGVRKPLDILRCLPDARRLRRDRSITTAVSTGSAIALGYLPYLAARGVECHYIESAARVAGPSLTGRVMRWVPRVRTYTQYRHWADANWHYGGSVFDGYVPVQQPRANHCVIRVVVTVGTAAEFPFRRLVEHLVPLLGADGDLARATGRAVEVLWQTGCTPVDDLPIAATPFMPARALSEALQRADIVVSHAGTGSALSALDAGRLPVLACRDHAYGEAGDGHQRQLASELASRGLGLEREPDAISVDDLLATLDVRICHSSAPTPFELVR